MNFDNDEEALGFINRLLERLHQAGQNNHGSKIEVVYVASGGQHVETQINVEDGGIGIQINNGKDNTPLAVSDKVIKSAVEELQLARDENDMLFFRNKKQWWAVYRVLYYFCNYPSQKTAFKLKMEELKVDKIDGDRDLSYESLSAASKEVPKMAIYSPETWITLKDINDNYKQQYIVADFLMIKLGIKS